MHNFEEEIDTKSLNGDAKKLAAALDAEKRRNAFLAEQLRASMNRVQELKSKARISPDATLTNEIPDLLDDAEAHIAIAAERFTTLMREAEQEAEPAQTSVEVEPVVLQEAEEHDLATEFRIEEDLDDVGARIMTLEEDILSRFGQETGDIEDLRERLEHIAIDVSHIIYAEANEQSKEESLFDRVRKYAADGVDETTLVEDDEEELIGRVADRMDTMKKVSLN